MPEITALGWFHTVMGIIALTSGVAALVKFREITLETRPGQIYLATTLITASTALLIFQHGGFGPAHTLAVLTLLALALGTVASMTSVFGKLSRYVRAVGYSATLLFHSIPAVTDGLLRLPVGDPILKSIEDPLLGKCYLALAVLFLFGIMAQLRWVSGQQPRLD